jgi:hypothetical protein
MQQFLTICYFIHFSLITRIARSEVFLFVMLMVLIVISIALHGSHTFIHTHAPLVESDPWNG